MKEQTIDELLIEAGITHLTGKQHDAIIVAFNKYAQQNPSVKEHPVRVTEEMLNILNDTIKAEECGDYGNSVKSNILGIDEAVKRLCELFSHPSTVTEGDIIKKANEAFPNWETSDASRRARTHFILGAKAFTTVEQKKPLSEITEKCKHPEAKREHYHDSSILCTACNCVIEQFGKAIDPPCKLG